jgi:hypothetical protein
MTYPGSDNPPWGQPGQQPYQGQPGQGEPAYQCQPGQQPLQQGQPAWIPPQGPGVPGQPERKSSVVKKVVLPVVGGLVALGLAGSAFGLIGGDPEVGDCVRMQGETSFDSVDCGSDEAQFRITGIDDQELNQTEFKETDEVCVDFESSEVALWIGDMVTEPGTIYCAAPVRPGG